MLFKKSTLYRNGSSVASVAFETCQDFTVCSVTKPSCMFHGQVIENAVIGEVFKCAVETLRT